MSFAREKITITGKQIIGAGAITALSLLAHVTQFYRNVNKDSELEQIKSNISGIGVMPPTVQLEDLKKMGAGDAVENVINSTGTHAEIDTVENNYGDKIPTLVMYKDSSFTNADGSSGAIKTQLGRYILK